MENFSHNTFITHSRPQYCNPLCNCNNENKRKPIKIQVGFSFKKIAEFDLYPSKQLICGGTKNGMCILSRFYTIFLLLSFYGALKCIVTHLQIYQGQRHQGNVMSICRKEVESSTTKTEMQIKGRLFLKSLHTEHYIKN